MIITFANLFGRQYEGGANWLEITLRCFGMLAEPPTCLVLDATADVLPASLREAAHVRAIPLEHTQLSRPRRIVKSLTRRVRRQDWEAPAITKIAARYNVDLWMAFAWFDGLGSNRPLLICYPDFQFRYFPELFSAGEVDAREQQWSHVAERADGIFAISEATARDALTKHPQIKEKLYVCGFPPVFDLGDLRLVPEDVRRKYRLPERFFLVSNQFWEHKNHALVLRALVRLKESGETPPTVVFTGRPYDPRRPDAFTRLLMYVNEQGLHEHCRFLGVLPREEQIALIRAAEAVIQPSRFEGRGAITEETCLLGTQLLCSDLATHRELNLPGTIFFDVDDVELLAELLRRSYPHQTKDARDVVTESRRLARDYGEQLMRICEDVLARHRGAPSPPVRASAGNLL